MRFHWLLAGLLVLSPQGGFAGEQVLNGHTFTLPDGFEIEVAAKTPLVDRPITMDFDERGRLYVTDSSGSNEPTSKQVVNPTHRIRRLEDVDGDGVYDKSTLFADKMMFPEGTLWHDGSLYVAAPPQIWKLTDTDDDGVSDKHEVWFDGKTLTGCANDLHGPYLGPEGYIYWCKGAFAEQTYEQPGKPPLVTKASHIFRRKADGTGPIENMMTGGMDNPVDLIFTPRGDIIFSTTFLQNPGGGLRDGLIHAVHGGVYGKVHNVTDFHPRTGDLMPPLVHMGAAAPCGLTVYESTVFGKEFYGNLFACQFNMYKVSRHELTPHGTTYVSTDTDFVSSNNLDFHPTDVMEDADGSLVICDTGGWYKLCCPTSQLEKADVLGAIYRVRRVDAPRVDDSRELNREWAKASAAELARLAGDSRPAVRERALRELPRLDLSKILTSLPQDDRTKLLILNRLEGAAARAHVRTLAQSADAEVRHLALRSICQWNDYEALTLAQSGLLTWKTPVDMRLHAEILGRIGAKSSVPLLLAAAGRQDLEFDRVLEHAITFALIEIADMQATAEGLTSESPRVRRISLIALDQMPGGKVSPEQVIPHLTSSDKGLREAALWLVTRHTEWGEALTDHLRKSLDVASLSDAQQEELTGLLTRFVGTASVQKLLATQVTSDRPDFVRRLALTVMAQSGMKLLPMEWVTPLAGVLSNSNDSFVPRAVTVIRNVPLPESGTEELTKALLSLASTSNNTELRLEAAAALPTRPLEPELFSLMIAHLDGESPVNQRVAAVDALTRAKLSLDQLGALAGAIAHVGPLELNRLLAIYEAVSDAGVGQKLIAALKQSPVLTSLRVDALKQRIAKFPSPVQEQAEALYAAINVEAAKQKERLDELVSLVGQGDIRRGQIVFGHQKAACTVCHAMGYKGGNVGPDLSRIGKIRTERDLLESILFPSVSLVRSYEPILVVTKAGQTHNGLIRRESADEIVLVTGAHQEARILRSDIEEIRPSTVSVMPAGLDTQLTKEQIIDLVTFLKSRQ